MRYGRFPRSTYGLNIHADAMEGLIVAYTSDEAEELETIMNERRDAGCPI